MMRANLAARIVAVACVWLAAVTPAAAGDQEEFAAAMRLYDECHYAAAYLRLVDLSRTGHREAERISNLMVRFGPQLYGSPMPGTDRSSERRAGASVDSAGLAAAGQQPGLNGAGGQAESALSARLPVAAE